MLATNHSIPKNAIFVANVSSLQSSKTSEPNNLRVQSCNGSTESIASPSDLARCSSSVRRENKAANLKCDAKGISVENSNAVEFMFAQTQPCRTIFKSDCAVQTTKTPDQNKGTKTKPVTKRWESTPMYTNHSVMAALKSCPLLEMSKEMGQTDW